ncbi:alkaline shock response membrane anchor protein AmaP [Streptomyces flaveolus]|uniref:alkaline shock response membrane anchor protein AmaP n=1 Tax=Streptomyces flaveolus TaxID=67297 RepID=UPI00342DFFF2
MNPHAAHSRLNRVLLALTGLTLLGGGLLILFAGVDVYRRWRLTPPAGWPLTAPQDVLLSTADRIRWSDQGWWWWPAVIAALALIALLALWWLVLQLLRPRPGAIPVGGTPPAQGVELRDRALGDAIATETSTLPGVQRARARVTGTARHPGARIDLTLGPHSSPRHTLSALCEGPLDHARRSTATDQLPTRVRLRVARLKPHRAQ